MAGEAEAGMNERERQRVHMLSVHMRGVGERSSGGGCCLKSVPFDLPAHHHHLKIQDISEL